MPRATFRFYEELNDHLPARRRKVEFDHEFPPRSTVKHVIEALGVPHTEVELILVNGHPVDFDHLLGEGDRVSVYPVFESLDVTPLVRLRPKPLRRVRFVLDVHLGRLATYLRLLGFDTLAPAGAKDEDLARLAAQGRILLTRDRGLLKRRQVTHGYWLRSTRPREQLAEVLRRFDLFRLVDPFNRCLRCNHPLVEVARESVAAELPPRTLELHQRFYRCPGCRRLYWEGSHHRAMERLVEEVRQMAPEGQLQPSGGEIK
ncbi:MAG TPA: Mut7-C RNAse domain-containing protein [Candidatus Nitrosotenuis sp.]|jgi:uncharacterized protein with PIN domain/sulfur carrier protein ThiS|nr:Mut7-C RNAse domain-containing protein [Candidatus Nitrosotenuis sp.]